MRASLESSSVQLVFGHLHQKRAQLAFWLRSDCVLIAFWNSDSKSVANSELIALHASFFSVSLCVVLFLYTRISSLCMYEVTCICLSMHMYMSIVTFYHGPYVDLFRIFVCSQAPCLEEFFLMLELRFELRFDLRFGPDRPNHFLSFLRPSFLTSCSICVLNLRFGLLRFAFWAHLSQSACVLELRFEKKLFAF